MAWTSPPTFVAGQILTAQMMNDLIAYVDWKASQAQQSAEKAEAAVEQVEQAAEKVRRAINLRGTFEE